MEGKSQIAPIIIKRVQIEGEGHHSGAWKIALADMMTAMMAFFLVLWLISSTSSEELSAIADYFKPADMVTGSGGEMTAIEKASASAEISLTVPEQPKQIGENGSESDNDQDLGEARRKIDVRNFLELEKRIKELIAADNSSSLDQIVFARDDEGLLIEIVDRENAPMFAIGTSVHLPRAREILQKVAIPVRDLPNKIIVRGHTDSRAYKIDDGRNNWLLSTERSDSTRLVLESYGVRHDRFIKIEGYADTMPFIPDDLFDARN